MNVWQGDFPRHNSLDDGYLGTAPVRSFPANGFGLYETTGNVREWTAHAFDERGRVQKGGLYLCHHSYCRRYRVACTAIVDARQFHRERRLSLRPRRVAGPPP